MFTRESLEELSELFKDKERLDFLQSQFKKYRGYIDFRKIEKGLELQVKDFSDISPNVRQTIDDLMNSTK